MLDNIQRVLPKDADPFGLQKIDFTNRIPERSEMFNNEEAEIYIQGCDFTESVDDLLLAWEIHDQFGTNMNSMHMLDAMTGPGRLGRDLLSLGAGRVTFHDGHNVMLEHARKKALEIFSDDRVSTVLSPVDALGIKGNIFDLVICHNSPHQLEDERKLQKAIQEFVRVTKPGGWVVIADFQRNSTPEFINALEERLFFTKKEIIPLLVPTFLAAFSKDEFGNAVSQTPHVKQWRVVDASLPMLTAERQERVNLDPVKGHVLDFSPISCRVIIQKEEV